MTDEEREREMEVCVKNGPTDRDLEVLARHSKESLETGYIFQSNEHLIEEIVKQAQASILPKLP